MLGRLPCRPSQEDTSEGPPGFLKDTSTMGQKENSNGDHRWMGLFFPLPIGFFGVPGIFDPQPLQHLTMAV